MAALYACIQRSLCAARKAADERDRSRAHKGSGNHQAERAEGRRNSPAVSVSVLASRRWPRRQQAGWQRSRRGRELQAARRTLRTWARRPLAFFADVSLGHPDRRKVRTLCATQRDAPALCGGVPSFVPLGHFGTQRMAVGAASSFTGSASLVPLTDACGALGSRRTRRLRLPLRAKTRRSRHRTSPSSYAATPQIAGTRAGYVLTVVLCAVALRCKTCCSRCRAASPRCPTLSSAAVRAALIFFLHRFIRTFTHLQAHRHRCAQLTRWACASTSSRTRSVS